MKHITANIFLYVLTLGLLASPARGYAQDQETYINCGDIEPQNYQVPYDANKFYYWDITGGQIISSTDNTVTVQWPDSVGSYIVSVYTTRFGCYGDTSTLAVIVEECPYLQLWIPSAITPNGDGHNEQFIIKGPSADDIKSITIYDRWGMPIFKTDGNNPWNGAGWPLGLYTVNIYIGNNNIIRTLTLIK